MQNQQCLNYPRETRSKPNFVSFSRTRCKVGPEDHPPFQSRLSQIICLLVAVWMTALGVNTAGAQGALTNGGRQDGSISSSGGRDSWTLTANPGDPIIVQIAKLSGGAAFTPMIELRAPDGAFLSSSSGGVAARLDVQADAGGTYTVVISDVHQTGTGTYRLTVNGLSDGLKLCPPTFSSGNLYVDGIGGTPGAGYTLLTTTNVALPMDLWTPLPTRQFDQFGVFTYTNSYSPEVPQQFFRLRLQ